MAEQEEPASPAQEPKAPITERVLELRRRMQALGMKPPPLTPVQAWHVNNQTSDKWFVPDYAPIPVEKKQAPSQEQPPHADPPVS